MKPLKAANVEFLHRKKEAQAEVPDVALLYACGQGELEALGLLFERHHMTVFRFLSRLAGTDAQDLDDLVQMTFIEVQRSAGSFKGKAAVKSWILGIAANIARHHVRSEVRRKQMIRVYRESEHEPKESPQRTLERSEMMARLADAVERLPYKLRVVFAMCDLEGVPGVEAAKILGLRKGTIWRRLHEARKTLRQALEASGE